MTTDIMHTLVVGAGFSGYQIALQAANHGSVCGTRRSVDSLVDLRHAGLAACVLDAENTEQDELTIAADESLRAQCAKATHLIICSGPDRAAPFNDPVHDFFSSGAVELPALRWLGYLSTIGVYGNHLGGWVDESTACQSTQVRSMMRLQAESCWGVLASKWQVPMVSLRLSGIYGPGRNAIKDALAGRARMLIKPEQVFNRIHVADLARATVAAARLRYSGILNITDDMPAAPQDVVRYAHYLAQIPAPPAVNFADATLSDMARSFYSENKRVSNALSKQALDFEYQYPSYKDGLDAVWRQMSELTR